MKFKMWEIKKETAKQINGTMISVRISSSCMNAWSTVYGTVLGRIRGAALLEEVCHRVVGQM